jgi:alpha-ketoglutarate-dependent 2,4-dichlorophenoxyacetate dioxygenase
MSPTIWPVTPDFAAEVHGVDLGAEPAPEALEAIKEAFWRYSVLVFPDQSLTQDRHVAFAASFGPLESTVLTKAVSDTPLRLRPDIADVSNLDHRDGIWAEDSRLRGLQLGNRLWHTDSSFKHTPALCSLLFAREIPPIGGQTEFADQRAAYDALPAAAKARLGGLVAWHSLMYSRERMGYTRWEAEERVAMAPVPQALVRTIPQSGRRSLYVPSHAGRVAGMDEAEGAALIDELREHAGRREFVYHHRWRTGDLVMWDNRCTQHRGLAFDDLRFRRDMQRATVADVANTSVQEGIPIPEPEAAALAEGAA